MNFEDFKKKAVDLKNDLEPKVKEKAQKAGKAVSDFVDEHIKNTHDDSESSENAEEKMREDEQETAHVDAEIDEEQADETLADKINNKFGKKNKTRKNAKSVKYKDVSEETEENINEETSDKEPDSVDEVKEANDEEPEVEKIEGEVVGSVKDRYNQVVQNVMPKVRDTAHNVGSKVKETFQNIAPKTKETVENIGPKIKETAENIGPKLKETAENIGPKIKKTAENIGPKLKKTAENIGPKVKETAEGIAPKVKDTVKSVGPKVYEGAKKTGETISFQGYRLRKTIGRKVKGAVKHKLGIKDNDEFSPDGIKYYEVKKKSSSKFINHLRTIRTHRRLVFRHCLRAGIPVQGLLHDLSKYSPSEFYYGVKFYRGDRSPNEGEREDHGFSYAWMHHKGRNKHHFEYWNDYNIEANKAMPVKMPLKYVIEMYCDRVAASKVYLKDKYTNLSPYEYFDKGRSRRTIHKETSDFLEKLLRMLAKKGEDYTFMYIKWYMKHHKDY